MQDPPTQVDPDADLETIIVREGDAGPASRSPSDHPLRVPITVGLTGAVKAHLLSPEPEHNPFELAQLSNPKPASRAKAGSARWIEQGEAVVVGGTSITAGLIYVGESLPNNEGWGDEPCLIKPSLRVARHPAVINQDDSLQYHANYANISSSERRAYIAWLAAGRVDPNVPAGMAMLFLYGLERRLILEGRIESARVMVREVEQLLRLHGGSAYFRNKAEGFLRAVAILINEANAPVELRPPVEWVSEMPFPVKIQLGGLLAERRAFQADDALLWLLSAPGASLRTPGHRCFPELHQLFRARFAARHARGLAVREPKRRLEVVYASASGTFSVTLPGPHEHLPDIGQVKAPLANLRGLLDACQTELDSYSRLLGRRPDTRGSLEAAVLLPTPLREAAVASAAEVQRALVLPLLRNQRVALVAPADLFDATGFAIESGLERLPASAVKQLVLRLDLLGFGLEPDRRYGGEALAATGKVALFMALEGAPVDPERPEFMQARAVLEVGTLAAAADGRISDAGHEAMLADLHATPTLSVAEIARLEASAYMLRGRADDSSVLRRAAKLPREAREAISATAVTVALADGQPTALRIAFLERLHRILGLPSEGVHTALHKGAAGSEISRRLPDATGNRFDAGRLAIVERDTAEAASLLAGILVEDTKSETVGQLPMADQASTRHAGLDSAHGTVLDAILARGSVPLAWFEAEARRLKLLPNGAADTINDWAYDRFEEPVLEVEGDVVTIPDHLRNELLAS